MCRVMRKCSPTLATNPFPEWVDTVHHQPSAAISSLRWIVSSANSAAASKSSGGLSDCSNSASCSSVGITTCPVRLQSREFQKVLKNLNTRNSKTQSLCIRSNLPSVDADEISLRVEQRSRRCCLG